MSSIQDDTEGNGLNADVVRDLYEHLYNRRMHIDDRIWEIRKHFTSLYTALITASIALITWFSQTQDISPPKSLATIPLLAVVLLIIGFLEFRRERE